MKTFKIRAIKVLFKKKNKEYGDKAGFEEIRIKKFPAQKTVIN